MPTAAYTNESELPTPALVIDEITIERNLARMADYCRAHKLNLRPHAKTHKSIEMARRQVAHGAIGLTVAKAGEAEVLSGATRDILVAYPALDASRVLGERHRHHALGSLDVVVARCGGDRLSLQPRPQLRIGAADVSRQRVPAALLVAAKVHRPGITG